MLGASLSKLQSEAAALLSKESPRTGTCLFHEKVPLASADVPDAKPSGEVTAEAMTSAALALVAMVGIGDSLEQRFEQPAGPSKLTTA